MVVLREEAQAQGLTQGSHVQAIRVLLVDQKMQLEVVRQETAFKDLSMVEWKQKLLLLLLGLHKNWS